MLSYDESTSEVGLSTFPSEKLQENMSPSSSATAGAGVAAGEGTIDETGGDSRNQFGDAGVPIGDDGSGQLANADPQMQPPHSLSRYPTPPTLLPQSLLHYYGRRMPRKWCKGGDVLDKLWPQGKMSRADWKDIDLWLTTVDITVDGDLQEEAAPAGEQSGPPAPKTAKQLTAKRNQERVKSILLLAIPDEYILKFHNVPDARSLWAAIKSSLDKAYDRFQKLISQLEVHAAPISKEDINQKFLRSLPPPWIQIALIVRNKPDIDHTDIDDLYNNLRVYEDEMKRSSNSTSNSQNLAFLSSENTSSTNKVSAANGNFGVNTARGTSSTNQVSFTPGADEVVHSLFAQQITNPLVDNKDLQQIDQDDLEELDIRWQVAMLTVRVQRFIQKIGRNLDFKGKQHVTFDKSKVECYNCHRKGHFAKECKSGRNQGKRPYGDNGRRNATTNEPSSQALVAQDGLGGYD
ncbi:ribonuclease H-like domain-containing protein [Tanacetum coccineum]